MWLIKNHKTGKFYKTALWIENDKLSMLYKYRFVKAGAITKAESNSCRKCMDKWPFIEIVTRFDGRKYTWMRDCDWFTWLVVLEEINN